MKRTAAASRRADVADAERALGELLGEVTRMREHLETVAADRGPHGRLADVQSALLRLSQQIAAELRSG